MYIVILMFYRCYHSHCDCESIWTFRKSQESRTVHYGNNFIYIPDQSAR